MRAKGAEWTRPGLPCAGSRGAGPCWVRMPLPSHALISGPRRTSGKFHTLCPCTVRQAGADGRPHGLSVTATETLGGKFLGASALGTRLQVGTVGDRSNRSHCGNAGRVGGPSPAARTAGARGAVFIRLCAFPVLDKCAPPGRQAHSGPREHVWLTCGPSPRALRFEPHPPPVKCTVSPDARGEERASC